MQQSTVISVGEQVTTRTSVLARAVAAAAGGPDPTTPAEPAPAHLLARYYRHVGDEDLLERDPAALLRAVLDHRELARRRPVGTAAVRIRPAATGGSGGSGADRCAVLEVVTDDMPFLIDSVTALLDGEGLAVDLIVHPQVVVRRDVTGTLMRVLDADPDDEGLPADAVTESWIRVELGREKDPEVLARVESRLRSALDDVRISVEDWARMRHRALEVADGLRRQAPSGIGADEAAEAADLLGWLAEEHFTFLGYREYRLVERGGEDTLTAVPGTGLGLLRHDQPRGSTGYRRLGARARARAREPILLVLTKANRRSTVHRRAPLDYVGIKVFDDAGRVIGEKRFLGLFGASAYIDDALRVPVVARKVEEVLRRSGLPWDSHSGKDLRQILQTYPRDELFQIGVDDLETIATGVLRLQGKRRTRLFVRPDLYGRFVSCLVFLPRERYTTGVRLRIQRLLGEAFQGVGDDHTALVGDGPLARLHVVVRLLGVDELDPDRLTPDAVRTVEDGIVRIVRTWEEDLAEAFRRRAGGAAPGDGDETAARCLRRWAGGWPEGYKEEVPPEAAVEDLLRFEALPPDGTPATALHRPEWAAVDERRLKVYHWAPLSLSGVLPYLTHLGAEVVDERPYVLVRADGTRGYLYDLGLRFPALAESSAADGADGFEERLRAALAAAWSGECDDDGFNRLVSATRLTWRQVAVLRAYARYLRQIGLPFGLEYVEACLLANRALTVALVDLFEARFDPDLPEAAGPGGPEVRARVELARARTCEELLDQVPGLDHDRILRGLLRAISATTRTNAYVEGAACLALKLAPRQLPDVPEPRPWAEVFVHAPRVEGVHLRFGAVARGGLRWSDRPEDVRTEVLGLVKAQVVKNAVIVPTGAKGGFVARTAPDPSRDREGWLAEGRACYRIFVGGLLDVTDDLADGVVRPPRRVVRADGDDPYLVVAADKGTATFSDLANEVAAERGFWLGDAFASGGSSGYDHKAMGITARGAWVSVERHLRDLGLTEGPVTTVGIGDMSGDVFGNGMLLSRRIALVAAFDHRHVFLDPDPDLEVAYAERRRLFGLPRSSWADVDPGTLSEGGGVHPRTAKWIPVSPQVARRLGIAGAPGRMTPSELIRAILTAPVDLLWNGGIGTYVKASGQTHADAADKANDAVRVDGRDLRARIVGEGGNLGLTQAGRVEAALLGRDGEGVRLNTDAVDNSAGVDCSDHEVIIKILLDGVVREGGLDRASRDALLVSMTEDVARLVLRDNHAQNVVLSTAVAQAPTMAPVHERFVRSLEEAGLDRAQEGVPGASELERRRQAGRGLTSPELCVLLAHAKIRIAEELLAGGLPDDAAATDGLLAGYFPPVLVERFPDAVAEHPLRREIVAGVLANQVVNECGITFVFRAQEELRAEVEEVCRAYLLVRDVFGTAEHLAALDRLDGAVPLDVLAELRLAHRRLLDRAVRWVLQVHPGLGPGVDAQTRREAVRRYTAAVDVVMAGLPRLLRGPERTALMQDAARLTGAGVPPDLAERVAGELWGFRALGIADLAADLGREVGEVADVAFAVSARLRGEALLERISALPRDDRWQALARASSRFDLYGLLGEVTRAVLDRADEDRQPGEEPDDPGWERVLAWEQAHAAALARAQRTVDDVLALEPADLAAVSVALRTLHGALAGLGRRA